MTEPDGRAGLCVLTFHRVVSACERDHDVTWTSFRGLLDAVVRDRRAVVTRLDSQESLRTPSIVLTFDDGTADHAEVGRELAGRAMAGIFFVPAGKIGAPGRLSLAQIHELHALGHVVASHGFSDVPLRNGMPTAMIASEVKDSKAFLEDALGTPVRYFAPPGGIGCRRLRSHLQRCGYHASRSMVWGIYRSLDARWQIPCVPVTELTVARGWVGRTLCAHALPVTMRSTWAVKSIVPEPARVLARRMLHHPFKTARRRAPAGIPGGGSGERTGKE